MKKKQVLALALCALLPMNAMAVTEGVVEEAPMVEIRTVSQAPEVSYLPDPTYYAGAPDPEWENAETWVECKISEDGLYYGVSQNPRLTKGEQLRAQKLMESSVRYEGESVLEKMEDVIVGVYALNPEDYDGEKVYVILPGTCLTDEQLLSIIAAYEELGLTFDPASLNYRNCSRGGGMETTRFPTEEEADRYLYLANLVKRGQLTPPTSLTATIRQPSLRSEYFCGMLDFTFTPYRRRTDEDFMAQLLALGVHDERDEIDHVDVEGRSRSVAYTVFQCPLSMELEYIYTDGGYAPLFFTRDGNLGRDYASWRNAFGASFIYEMEENIRAFVITWFDKETDELVSIEVMHQNSANQNQPSYLSDDVTQERIEETIAETEAILGFSDLQWHVMWDEATLTDWGNCIPVRALMEDEWMLTVYIGGDDGKAHGFELSHGTLVDELPALDEGNNG